ncbi:MAG: ylqF [Clostridia bacterium]|jgi:ribosome biogenesis GTPase A|nr:ylqF [Clostridia bacterium]
MNINWYPGHMVTAAKSIKEDLKLIDIVVEVLDSRIPKSSQNYIIDDMAEGKERIVVLNKYDIADKSEVNRWKKYFEDKGISVVLTNAQTGENISKLLETIKSIGNKIYEKKYENKKIDMKPIFRVLIVGIPNVGKSTIINKISKKNTASVGNKPGVTVRKQWIRVGENIELLDTPGLLWPRLEDNNAGLKLALTGNIKQEILDMEELAVEGVKLLIKNEKYKVLLKEKYKLDDDVFEKEVFEIIESIGKKRGCLISGGGVDTEKASRLFLDDLKNGKIGNISLDNV